MKANKNINTLAPFKDEHFASVGLPPKLFEQSQSPAPRPVL